ncbi:MAG: hypothetical protein L6Q57_05790 [Alphaproteobacteria bacterium]|nr:hypothetical protein [Alphaproteobacteria bacterium]
MSDLVYQPPAKFLQLRDRLMEALEEYGHERNPKARQELHVSLVRQFGTYAGVAMDAGGYDRQISDGVSVFTLPRKSQVRDQECKYIYTLALRSGDPDFLYSVSITFLVGSIGLFQPKAVLRTLFGFVSAGFFSLFRGQLKPSNGLSGVAIAAVLCEVETALGRPERTEAIIHEAADADPDSAFAVIRTALEEDEIGNIGTALEYVESYLARNPENDVLQEPLQRLRDQLRQALDDGPGDVPQPA